MTKNVNIDAKGRQMLELLAQGASARTVAKKMGYSEGTTRVYLHNLYKVLGVRNKTEAVIWLLNRRHQGEVAAVSPPPPPPATVLEEPAAEMAAREGLHAALGVMGTFVGPYSRVWEGHATHKGGTVDAKAQERRAQARELWNALLKGDFAFGKAMHDEGQLDELAYRAPSEAVIVALMGTVVGIVSGVYPARRASAAVKIPRWRSAAQCLPLRRPARHRRRRGSPG